MKGEDRLLRLGENLVGRASRELPTTVSDERYREWAAELPAILHDPQIRFAPLRAIRMLVYAADILGSTNFKQGRAPRQIRADAVITALLILVLIASSANVAWNVWDTVQTPGQGVNYANLAGSLLLVAYPISALVRGFSARTTWLTVIGANLVGLATNLWSAAHAPGDWVNYVLPACSLLILLASLAFLRLLSRWTGSRAHGVRGMS